MLSYIHIPDEKELQYIMMDCSDDQIECIKMDCNDNQTECIKMRKSNCWSKVKFLCGF